MPASPSDADLKKQALMKLIGTTQMPKPMFQYQNGNPISSPAMAADSVLGAPIRRGLWQASHEQNNNPDAGFLSAKPAIEGLKAAYNQMGQDPRTAPTSKQVMQEAGMSSLPLSQTPGIQALYKKPGEESEAFDMRPTAGGPLDVSPAGVSGEALSYYTDPMMHAGAPTTMGASVKSVQEAYPNLSKYINPEEIQKSSATYNALKSGDELTAGANSQLPEELQPSYKYEDSSAPTVNMPTLKNQANNAENIANTNSSVSSDQTQPMSRVQSMISPKKTSVDSDWTSNGESLDPDVTNAAEALDNTDPAQFGKTLVKDTVPKKSYGKVIIK